MSEPLSFTRSRLHPSGKLVILLLAALALMVLDTRYSAVQQLRNHATTVLHPLLWLANQPIRLYAYGNSLLRRQNALLEENSRLQSENRQLKAQNHLYAAQFKEWQELRSLSRLQARNIGPSITAEVISNGKDPLSDKLIIDKGSRDGLQAGDAVIDHSGLLGQLTQVRPYNAEVTVLSNAQTVVPVTVARTGVRSLLYGTGNSVKLRYFPTDADLQTGDILLTSGLDSVYPLGIPVAGVDKAERIPGTPYYQTELHILSSPLRSKYVLVLSQTDRSLPDTGNGTTKASADGR
ncbi:MAG: rod shape-determining protein MreC [Neisseria sp.]|nr:rod shape-determining protein MreC [Neisseria sp.]